MRAVLIFDADNTLWDTDGVFRRAQLALLRKLKKPGLLDKPESSLKTLRLMDQELGKKLGAFEYDFKILPIAAAYYYLMRGSREVAVKKALRVRNDKIEPALADTIAAAYESLKRGLKKTPDLYPDTISVLSYLRRLKRRGLGIASILLSEGDPSRLDRILRKYKIRKRGFFDELIIGRKSRQIFQNAKEAGLKHLHGRRSGERTIVVVIGDSLERDVKFGNQIGAITVYKSSTYKGREQAHRPLERPDYRISSLGQLPIILSKLGLSKPAPHGWDHAPKSVMAKDSRTRGLRA